MGCKSRNLTKQTGGEGGYLVQGNFGVEMEISRIQGGSGTAIVIVTVKVVATTLLFKLELEIGI